MGREWGWGVSGGEAGASRRAYSTSVYTKVYGGKGMLTTTRLGVGLGLGVGVGLGEGWG